MFFESIEMAMDDVYLFHPTVDKLRQKIADISLKRVSREDLDEFESGFDIEQVEKVCKNFHRAKREIVAIDRMAVKEYGFAGYKLRNTRDKLSDAEYLARKNRAGVMELRYMENSLRRVKEEMKEMVRSE